MFKALSLAGGASNATTMADQSMLGALAQQPPWALVSAVTGASLLLGPLPTVCGILAVVLAAAAQPQASLALLVASAAAAAAASCALLKAWTRLER